MPRRKKPHADDLIKCPSCGVVDDSDGYDCAGAEDLRIICTKCSTEFDPVTGQAVPFVPLVLGETQGVLFD